MSKMIPLNLKIILYMLYFSTLSSSSSASTSLSTPHRRLRSQIQISHCDFTSPSTTTQRLRSRGRSYLLTSPGRRRRRISPLAPAKATSGTDSPGELTSSNREFLKKEAGFDAPTARRYRARYARGGI
ncbi:hypothetical protein Bca4012_044821 [Brassica carinata]|uniref:Uncharacterized protein n=1 Tax=Brassica carinata TaxID=52824 RepID=A0A8X7P043_BRACI|nr:hypothetical protein Bca52824_095594 [Brassica carinata]